MPYKSVPYMRQLAQVVYDHMVESAIEVNGEVVYPYPIGHAVRSGLDIAGETDRTHNDLVRIYDILIKRWKVVEKGEPISLEKKKGNQWKLKKETEQLQKDRAEAKPSTLEDLDPCPRCDLLEERVRDDIKAMQDTIDSLMNELNAGRGNTREES